MGDLSENFSKREFACKCGCGFNAVNPALVVELEKLRARFRAPVRIMSGCRCESHNRAVGGAKNSQHVLGNAADVIIQGVPARVVAGYLEGSYPSGYGVGRYLTFTHFDVRKGAGARWKG